LRGLFAARLSGFPIDRCPKGVVFLGARALPGQLDFSAAFLVPQAGDFRHLSVKAPPSRSLPPPGMDNQRTPYQPQPFTQTELGGGSKIRTPSQGSTLVGVWLASSGWVPVGFLTCFWVGSDCTESPSTKENTPKRRNDS